MDAASRPPFPCSAVRMASGRRVWPIPGNWPASGLLITPPICSGSPGRTARWRIAPTSIPAARSAVAESNPETDPSWSGRRQDLDGSKSCSVVVDPEQVTELFSEGVWPETRWLDEADILAGRVRPQSSGADPPGGSGHLRTPRRRLGSGPRGCRWHTRRRHAFTRLSGRPGGQCDRADADVRVPGPDRLGLQHVALHGRRIFRRRPRPIQALRAANAIAGASPSFSTSSTTTIPLIPSGPNGLTTPTPRRITSTIGTRVGPATIRNRTAATSTMARVAGRRDSGRRWCARCSPAAPPPWSANSISTASGST